MLNQQPKQTNQYANLTEDELKHAFLAASLAVSDNIQGFFR
jgi:hypothetical protein